MCIATSAQIFILSLGWAGRPIDLHSFSRFHTSCLLLVLPCSVCQATEVCNNTARIIIGLAEYVMQVRENRRWEGMKGMG